MSTGPTGILNVETYRMTMLTGPTGTDATVLAMFPSVTTGPVESPNIATLDELMSSRAAILAKESADADTLKVLVSPTREAFRPQLFQWAAAGFPDMYIVQTFEITPPAICADGVTRELGRYIEYSLGTHLGNVIDGIKALMVGIGAAWSLSGNTLRIHVSKI